ncbi:OmpH family outer membrane protein [Segetibacter sp. 3557_3]|uniref:OmpH family outer membrane protein n=1 Tax=Segetibacter sp. 3557_3 TaxID=2547429 RepID=UPI0010591CF8|nr:OmpH family outer membrane protein [Segetibacter sp. 3557_3]TDH23091.1 OmpH family outer membrane protein [Segetibacter sp. 3557_3]
MMKKVLMAVLVFGGSIFATSQVNAQKIGVFDLDIMVSQALPEYRAVDSMVQTYERDSLSLEYDYALKEYNRLDSTYKLDSAAKKPASVLNYIKQQKNEIATTIIYWQQISQQKSGQKRQMLANPLYQRVLSAYQKVLQANTYLVVLKPEAIEFMGSPKIENIFEKVAREMKITLPEQLRSSEPEPTQQPASKPPVSRPAPKK